MDLESNFRIDLAQVLKVDKIHPSHEIKQKQKQKIWQIKIHVKKINNEDDNNNKKDLENSLLSVIIIMEIKSGRLYG